MLKCLYQRTRKSRWSNVQDLNRRPTTGRLKANGTLLSRCVPHRYHMLWFLMTLTENMEEKLNSKTGESKKMCNYSNIFKQIRKIFRQISVSSAIFLDVISVCRQGRLDALWALLRRQYDRVSLMRPTSADQVEQRRKHSTTFQKYFCWKSADLLQQQIENFSCALNIVVANRQNSKVTHSKLTAVEMMSIREIFCINIEYYIFGEKLQP